MILTQAIETCDTQGKFLSAVEREDIDRLTLQTAKSGAPGAPVNVESFLHEFSVIWPGLPPHPDTDINQPPGKEIADAFGVWGETPCGEARKTSPHA